MYFYCVAVVPESQRKNEQKGKLTLTINHAEKEQYERMLHKCTVQNVFFFVRWTSHDILSTSRAIVLGLALLWLMFRSGL